MKKWEFFSQSWNFVKVTRSAFQKVAVAKSVKMQANNAQKVSILHQIQKQPNAESLAFGKWFNDDDDDDDEQSVCGCASSCRRSRAAHPLTVWFFNQPRRS